MDLSEQVVKIIAEEMRKSKGWFGFVGVVTIVFGVLTIFQYPIGIVWIPLLLSVALGITLLQVFKCAKSFCENTDPSELVEFISMASNCFKN